MKNPKFSKLITLIFLISFPCCIFSEKSNLKTATNTFVGGSAGTITGTITGAAAGTSIACIAGGIAGFFWWNAPWRIGNTCRI